VNELVAGQKLLAEILQKQQMFLAQQIKSQQAALDRQHQAISQQWWQPECYGCGSRSHIWRDGPNNRQNQQGGSKSKCSDKELQALNEKTPWQ